MVRDPESRRAVRGADLDLTEDLVGRRKRDHKICPRDDTDRHFYTGADL